MNDRERGRFKGLVPENVKAPRRNRRPKVSKKGSRFPERPLWDEELTELQIKLGGTYDPVKSITPLDVLRAIRGQD